MIRKNVIILTILFFVGISFFVPSKYFKHTIYLPQELQDLINNQLSGRKKISEESMSILDEKIKRGEVQNLARIILYEKQVTALKGPDTGSNFRLEIIISYLQGLVDAISNSMEIKNTTFLLYYHDGISRGDDLYRKVMNIKNLPPIFVFSIDKDLDGGRDKFILFPDDHTLGDDAAGDWTGWRRLYPEMTILNKKSKWEDKISKIFWRGKMITCESKCQSSARNFLVEFGKKNEFVDAAFVNPPQITEIKTNKSPFISRDKQIKYKYLINIDGYTATYPGYLWRLYSDSLVIKQESMQEQWFYQLFKPWDHYVPIENDLSNIEDIIFWLKNNEEEAKNIAYASSERVKEFLSPQMIDAYLISFLTQYTSLLDFRVSPIPISYTR